MDWKAAGNYVLLVGLFVAMVTMFNQVNGRLDTMQAEMNRRFDTMQTENNRRFDEMNRRFEQVLEVLRLFKGRITRLEEKAGIGSGNAE